MAYDIPMQVGPGSLSTPNCLTQSFILASSLYYQPTRLTLTSGAQLPQVSTCTLSLFSGHCCFKCYFLSESFPWVPYLKLFFICKMRLTACLSCDDPAFDSMMHEDYECLTSHPLEVLFPICLVSSLEEWHN